MFVVRELIRITLILSTLIFYDGYDVVEVRCKYINPCLDCFINLALPYQTNDTKGLFDWRIIRRIYNKYRHARATASTLFLRYEYDQGKVTRHDACFLFVHLFDLLSDSGYFCGYEESHLAIEFACATACYHWIVFRAGYV